MQTFETLMLRLTTNVTVSPASSARSSSAASRMSSIASGRVLGEQRGELLGGQPRAVARPLDRAPTTRSRADRTRSSRRPEPRRGMKLQYFVLTTSSTPWADPLGVDVLRVDAQPLGQRDAVGGQPLADLVRRRERVLGRDVVAVGAQAAEVGRARGDELRPPVGEVRRDLDADVGPGSPRASRDQPHHVVERHRRRPRRARRGAGRRASPVRQ